MAKAKKYRDHHKLGITLAEWLALLGVREALASGALHHQKRRNTTARHITNWPINGTKHTFNMGLICRQEHCGSVGCIGGYMALVTGQNTQVTVRREHPNRELAKLFFPPSRSDYNTITPKQAVQALDNYLTKGKASWHTICGLKEERFP